MHIFDNTQQKGFLFSLALSSAFSLDFYHIKHFFHPVSDIGSISLSYGYRNYIAAHNGVAIRSEWH